MPSAHGPPTAAIADPEEGEVVTFLSDPAAYPSQPPRVDVIETLCARVFLAGDHAYKVKKRVRLPWLDFSTLEQRRQASTREIELNQPHAPEIYLGLVPITRDGGGRLQVGGNGDVVEWAVHMRRFDQEALLGNRAEMGPLPDALSKALADVAVRYHRAAAIANDVDGAEVIASIVRQLTTALGPAHAVLGAEDARRVVERLTAAFDRVSPLLSQRSREGCIRRCHGDLHLGNVVVFEGTPVPFDALEFSEELATIDVLYDLAFLLMDLDNRSDRNAANVVLNAYVGAAPVGGEIEGLACLPLFLACRAGVRAIVALERLGQIEEADRVAHEDSARRFVDLATRYLDPPPGALIAVGGLSGTGKSTLGAAIAPLIGPAPGALHVRSDVERKRLFAVAETERLGAEHYRPEVSEQVYAVLYDKAKRALAASHAAVVDAVFSKPEERAAIEAIAREMGRPFVGLWLVAPQEKLIERVEARRGDASDADRAVVGMQLTYETGPIAWRQVDTSGTRAQSLANAQGSLRAAGITLVERGPLRL